MFKSFFEFINSFFPYKTYHNTNKIYVVEKGVKKELKRKIRGLRIVFGKKAKNNIVELHLPLFFNDTVFELSGSCGKITIKHSKNKVEKANFQCASYGEIFIDEDSRITMPNLLIITNNNTKENPSKVIIGKSCQIGQDIIIRTSDGHAIFNVGENVPFNAPQDIVIGDNVWLGARTTVLKGSKIPNNTIVGSNTLVNKKFVDENIILAGVPAKIVKRNVYWKREGYGDAIRLLEKKNSLTLKEIHIKRIKYKISKLFF